VLYPPAAGGKSLGCSDDEGGNPYTAGEYAGSIVFVDRGLCAISWKVANLAFAGATAAIVGVVNADAPFAASYGGGNATIPGFMLSLADANLLRTGSGVVRLSATNVLPLSGSMASTSSRGPRFDDNIAKPEIGAPGASISADSGGFTATSAFGGTSGAAPMVTGAAALLKSARPFLSASDIKQLLVNTGETQVYQPPSASTVLPNQLAPITRIGGGEVRVDRALFSPVIVTDVTGDKVSRVHGVMSFGYLDASKPLTTLTRKLEVENRSFFPQVYKVEPTLRYQDDVDTGAVTMTVSPSTVVVYPFSRAQVKVKLTVDGTKLRKNLMSSGPGGNAIGPLTANEYDGYVFFKGKHHQVSMPWHILPRKSAELVANVPNGKLPATDPITSVGVIPLTNQGVGDAQMFAYSLLGTGPDTPRGDRGEGQPNPTIRAAAVNTFLVSGADCGTTAETDFVWEFVFHMHERKASPVGTFHEVDIDIDGDGQVDALVVSGDAAGVTSLSDGRQVSIAYDLVNGTAFAGFFVEHATNSRNVILRACGIDLGLTVDDIGRPMRADFYAYNWYFGGDIVSHLGPFRITPYGEEFAGPPNGALLGYQQSANLPFVQYGLFPGTDAHQGVLLINNTDFGSTSRGGATFKTEATILQR
jgi:hypothetical protein